MNLRPLPPEVEELLSKIKPPARLRAHLTLVHDVACQLTGQVKRGWPAFVVNERLVHLGAAIHDMGKVVHREELSEPGHSHEDAGRKFLIEHGWPEDLARFAVSHASNLRANDPLEDLLVAVADKVWKGKRDDALEQALLRKISALSGQEPWQAWLALDDILTSLADNAPDRLRWQANHAI